MNLTLLHFLPFPHNYRDAEVETKAFLAMAELIEDGALAIQAWPPFHISSHDINPLRIVLAVF